MPSDDAEPAGHPRRPIISVGYDLREGDKATVDAVVRDLNQYADAKASPIYRFSEFSVSFTLVLDLLLSTLTGIGANALWDALKSARESRRRLTLTYTFTT